MVSPRKIKNKARIPSFTTLSNIVLKILDSTTKQEKEIKGIQIGKKEVKPSLFANSIVVYIEIPSNIPKQNPNKQTNAYN